MKKAYGSIYEVDAARENDTMFLLQYCAIAWEMQKKNPPESV